MLFNFVASIDYQKYLVVHLRTVLVWALKDP
jgi:hypothetical protein